MSTSTAPTAAQIIGRHKDDVAFVAEAPPAATLEEFIDQLETAERNLGMARINGAEDLGTARTFLEASRDESNAPNATVLLSQAAEYLNHVYDMAREYRDMVG